MLATIRQLRRTILETDYRKSSRDLLSSPLWRNAFYQDQGCCSKPQEILEDFQGKEVLNQMKGAMFWGREVLKGGLSEPAAAGQVPCPMFWGVQVEENNFPLRVKRWAEPTAVCKSKLLLSSLLLCHLFALLLQITNCTGLNKVLFAFTSHEDSLTELNPAESNQCE